MPERHRTVLVVEDNGDDAALIRVAFRRAGYDHIIQIVQNPGDAICYLKGDRPYDDRQKFPMPDLVLLDHEMPGDGWEVLQWLRRQPGLFALPVLILSGSENPAHQKRAAGAGATAYYIKPPDLRGFVKIIKTINETWLFSSPGGDVGSP